MFNYSVYVNVLPNPKGNLRAFADLIIEDVMVVSGFKVIESASGELFVGAPSEQYTKKDGTKDWIDKIRFREELEEGERRGPIQTRIYQSILEKYEEYAKGGPRKAAPAARNDETPTKKPTRTSTFDEPPF
jgi:DNA-binding cell septation regulator SpoVG